MPLEVTQAMLDGDIAAFREAMHVEIARLTRERLGYDFGEERVARVAKASAEFMAEGWPYPYAFAGALSDELMLYGDPEWDGVELTGILNAKE